MSSLYLDTVSPKNAWVLQAVGRVIQEVSCFFYGPTWPSMVRREEPQF